MLNERSVQTVSSPFNIFKNKGNVEAVLNESWNQLKFDSTHFQQASDIWFNNCVERMLKQMLKPFNQAFKHIFNEHRSYYPNKFPFLM